MSAKIVLILTLAVIASGCSSVAPTRLTPAEPGQQLVLAHPFVYTVDRQLTGAQTRYSVTECSYAAVGRDQVGMYYVGPRNCFTSTVLKTGWAYAASMLGTTNGFDCGILVLPTL